MKNDIAASKRAARLRRSDHPHLEVIVHERADLLEQLRDREAAAHRACRLLCATKEQESWRLGRRVFVASKNAGRIELPGARCWNVSVRVMRVRLRGSARSRRQGRGACRARAPRRGCARADAAPWARAHARRTTQPKKLRQTPPRDVIGDRDDAKKTSEGDDAVGGGDHDAPRATKKKKTIRWSRRASIPVPRAD